MTREQLDAIRARVEAALTYERSEYVPEEGAYVSPAAAGRGAVEWMACPLCDGDGEVEGQRYDAKETLAATVVAYGVGEGLHRAEDWVENAPADMRALLAEVERLTAERDALQVGDSASTALGANERFAPSEHALVYIEKWCDGSGPCAVELEPHGHWRLSRSVPLLSVRKAEAATAFARGVAAMREAAAQRCEISPIHGEKTTTARKYADAVRALPDPEDTP